MPDPTLRRIVTALLNADQGAGIIERKRKGNAAITVTILPEERKS
jgi:hypothetical protein